MKKIMTLMLGLGLVAGTATFAFAQTNTDKKTTKKKKGGTDKKTAAPKSTDKKTPPASTK